MTIISKHKNMIKLFYSSSSSIGKQTYSYLKSSYKDLLAIDITKTKVTGTQWKELAENLNKNISDFIDKNHPDFTKNYNGDTSLNEDDWIKVLQNKPEVLINPVVILGENYYQIGNPSDITKYLEPNSKGIDEKKHI